MSLASVTPIHHLDDARDELDTLVAAAPDRTCRYSTTGLHVQQADELWCQVCGEFVNAGEPVIAPAV